MRENLRITYNEHYNIFENINDEVRLGGKLIDVGRGDGVNIFDFEESKFEFLTGITIYRYPHNSLTSFLFVLAAVHL